MVQFDKDMFLDTLRYTAAPSKITISGVHSEYLQREVFDKLKRGESVDLMALDWNAFDMCHVTPQGYDERYESNNRSWLRGLNRHFRRAEAVSLLRRNFF